MFHFSCLGDGLSTFGREERTGFKGYVGEDDLELEVEDDGGRDGDTTSRLVVVVDDPDPTFPW